MNSEQITKMKNMLSKKEDDLRENARKQTELRKESDKIYDEIFELRSNIAVAQRKLEKMV